ncbi:hypothetical protein C8R42DRAFT_180672 [Lentinula raphanica]|nr:hypothetical protein C8R42DRAFT_180672 [Lentinula raphanica]
MKAVSTMYRARVVVQVLILILVPLLPFCYALPTPFTRTQGLGASQAPSIPQSASKPPTPTDPPPPYDMPLPPYTQSSEPSKSESLFRKFGPANPPPPTYSSQGNSSSPSLIIYHYIEFPEYPAGSDFGSFNTKRDVVMSPKERRKLEQLIEVQKEVMNRFATYIKDADDKEVFTEKFRTQFGHVSRYRVLYTPHWYPSYHMEPGDEAHAKMESVVYDETHGRTLREEKWLVTVQRLSLKTWDGQVLGAKVEDVKGATYPKVRQPSKLKKVLKKVFKKPGWHSN